MIRCLQGILVRSRIPDRPRNVNQTMCLIAQVKVTIMWRHFDTDNNEDGEFLAALDHQLADAVTFLPPAMRAGFHAQMAALIKLTARICEADRAELDCEGRSHIVSDIDAWRAERARIAERTQPLPRFCECPPDGTRRWDSAGHCHACGRASIQERTK